MSAKQSLQCRALSRWVGWFFFWNTIVILAVGLSYISVLQSFSDFPLLGFFGEVFGISFVVLAFIGQSALFAFFGGGIVYLSALLYPRRWFVIFASVFIGSLSVLMLIVDAILYHLYHYHLAALVWNILVSGAFDQVISLSLFEWFVLSWIFVGVVCLESLIAFWVWRQLKNTTRCRHGRLIFGLLTACLFLSYALYFAADFIASHPKQVTLTEQVDGHFITSEAKIVPYYVNFLREADSSNIAGVNDGLFVQNSVKNQPLDYPWYPIRAKTPRHPYNIVIIAIDTWRYDMMNKEVTPNIAMFAKRSINFTDNYSGGNSTQPGIFSLFYSLPPTYWSAMLNQHRGPVFIKQLLKDHYQMGVYASAELTFPEFDKTVFRDVPNLQTNTPGENAQQRDEKITSEFNLFVDHRNRKKPFFGFLFYDAVHGYCENGDTYAKPFQPAIGECDRLTLNNNTNPMPYINRYKNAVLYDDSLVGKVLHNLEAQHLLKNTIVIITADHGEEFNDEHLDYWGHASAFDPYQLRTPLIVYWPGKDNDTIYSQSSHYDIVPTLMKDALGVTNPIYDYSVGTTLFSQDTPRYLIAGSYHNYAVLQPNQTTIVYPGGDYDITYRDGYPKPHAKLNPILMRKVYKQLNDYYQ